MVRTQDNNNETEVGKHNNNYKQYSNQTHPHKA